MDSKNGEDSEDSDRISKYLSNGPRTPELIIVSDASEDGVCPQVSPIVEKQTDSNETRVDCIVKNSNEEPRSNKSVSAELKSAESIPYEPNSAHLSSSATLQMIKEQTNEKSLDSNATISALNRIVQSYRKMKYKEKPAPKSRCLLPKVTEPDTAKDIVNTASPGTSTINGYLCNVTAASGTPTINRIPCNVTATSGTSTINGIPCNITDASGSAAVNGFVCNITATSVASAINGIPCNITDTSRSTTVNGYLCNVTAASVIPTMNGIPCNVTAASESPILNGVPCTVSVVITVPHLTYASNQNGNIHLPEVVNNMPRNISQPNIPPPNPSSPRENPNFVSQDTTSVLPSSALINNRDITLCSENLNHLLVPSSQNIGSIGVPNLNTETSFQKTLNHIAHLKSLNKQINETNSTSFTPVERSAGTSGGSYITNVGMFSCMQPFSNETEEIQSLQRYLNEKTVTSNSDLSNSAPLNQTFPFHKATLSSESNRNAINHVIPTIGYCKPVLLDQNLPGDAIVPHSPSGPTYDKISPQIVTLDSDSDADCSQEQTNLNGTPEMSTSNLNSVASRDLAITNTATMPQSTTDKTFANNGRFPQNNLIACSLAQESKDLNGYLEITPGEYTSTDLSKTASLNPMLSDAMTAPHSTNYTNIANRPFFPQNISCVGSAENQLLNRYLADSAALSQTASPINPLLPHVAATSHPSRYLSTVHRRMFPHNISPSYYRQEINQQQNRYLVNRETPNVRGSAFHIPRLPASMANPQSANNADVINHEMFPQNMMPCSSVYGNCQMNQLQEGTAEAANMNLRQNKSVNPMLPLAAAKTYKDNNASTVNQRMHQQNILSMSDTDWRNQQRNILPVVTSEHSTNITSHNVPPQNTEFTATKKMGRPRKRKEETVLSSTTKRTASRARRSYRGRGRKQNNRVFTGGGDNMPRVYTSNIVSPHLGYAGPYQMPAAYMYARNESQNCSNNYSSHPNYNPSINRQANNHVSNLNVPFNNPYLSQMNCQTAYPNAYNTAGMYSYPHQHFNPPMASVNYNESCPRTAIASVRSFPTDANGFLSPNQINNPINAPGRVSFLQFRGSNPQDMNHSHFQDPSMYSLSTKLLVNENVAHSLPSYQETSGVNNVATSDNRGNQSGEFNNDLLENPGFVNSEEENSMQETMKPNQQSSTDAQRILEGNRREFPVMNSLTSKDACKCHLPEDLSTRAQENTLKRVSQLDVIDYLCETPTENTTLVSDSHNSNTLNTDILNSPGLECNANKMGETQARILDNVAAVNSETGGMSKPLKVQSGRSLTNDPQTRTSISTNRNRINSDMKPKSKLCELSDQSSSSDEGILPKKADGDCSTRHECNASENQSLLLGILSPKKKIRLDKANDNKTHYSLILARKAYEEMRFLDFFHIVTHNIFPVCDHGKLRDMWNKAQLFHYQNTTGLPITAYARYKICELNPAPPSILGTYRITPPSGFQT